MLILAVESSAKPVSVAVLEICEDTEPKLLGQYFQNNGFSHSRTLLVLVESLLENLEIKLADIGLIAVSNGPGSFTGVRIGVSAVKGLAWGLDIPVCGVSSLEAMAYQITSPDVIICAVMDARRNQVYNALFERRDGSVHRLCADRAISVDELAAELGTYDKPCIFIGDGTDVCVNSGLISSFDVMPELCRFQTAYGVAAASLKTEKTSAVDLEPVYLRPSQAEREAVVNNI